MNPDKTLAILRQALTSTARKCSDDIKKIQQGGGIPADYSLGFANAMIFAASRSMPGGEEPTYFTRTTSIGQLVKPIALERGDEPWLNPRYRAHVEAVLKALGDEIDGAPASWVNPFTDLCDFLDGKEGAGDEPAITADVAQPTPPSPEPSPVEVSTGSPQ